MKLATTKHFLTVVAIFLLLPSQTLAYSTVYPYDSTYFWTSPIMIGKIAGGNNDASVTRSLIYPVQNGSVFTRTYGGSFGSSSNGPVLWIAGQYWDNEWYTDIQTVEVTATIDHLSGVCNLSLIHSTFNNIIAGVSPGSGNYIIPDITSDFSTTTTYTMISGHTNRYGLGLAIVNYNGTAGNCTIVVHDLKINDVSVLSTANSLITLSIPDSINVQTDTINYALGFMIFLMAMNTWYVVTRRTTRYV